MQNDVKFSQDSLRDVHHNIITTGCFCNTFEYINCICVKKTQKTSIVTFWFIYCLSISDTMIGVTGLMHNLLRLKLNLESAKSQSSLSTTITGKMFMYFIATSGHLIFIIAIDRCIHMTYSDKYNTIITQSRARWIMLFNGVCSILPVLQHYIFSGTRITSSSLGLNIFYVAVALMVCAVYIKAYFAMKRKVAALKIGKRRNNTVCHEPDKRSEFQNKLPRARHCSSPSEMNLGAVIESNEKSNVALPCVLTKRVTVHEPQGKTSVISGFSANSAIQLTENGEKHEQTRRMEISSGIAKNSNTYKATNVDIECDGKQVET